MKGFLRQLTAGLMIILFYAILFVAGYWYTNDQVWGTRFSSAEALVVFPIYSFLYPLHFAAANNNVAKIERLIADGADVNAEDKDDWTALRVAVEENAEGAAELLRANGADGWTALHLAARDNDKETAELLIDNGADVNAKTRIGTTALHLAASENAKEIAKMLIAHGADVDAQKTHELFGWTVFGWTVLHSAAQSNAKETAEVLIINGADVNAKDSYGRTVLDIAVQQNANETTEVLRANSAISTPPPPPSLHYPARYNDIAEAKRRLDAGARENVNKKDNDGWAALHIAAKNNADSVARILLENGADVNAKLRDYGLTSGGTALHIAAENNAANVARVLLEYDANLNIKNNDGRTALQIALLKDSPKVATLLKEWQEAKKGWWDW